jgi:hypothetical protein
MSTQVNIVAAMAAVAPSAVQALLRRRGGLGWRWQRRSFSWRAAWPESVPAGGTSASGVESDVAVDTYRRVRPPRHR